MSDTFVSSGSLYGVPFPEGMDSRIADLMSKNYSRRPADQLQPEEIAYLKSVRESVPRSVWKSFDHFSRAVEKARRAQEPSQKQQQQTSVASASEHPLATTTAPPSSSSSSSSSGQKNTASSPAASSTAPLSSSNITSTTSILTSPQPTRTYSSIHSKNNDNNGGGGGAVVDDLASVAPPMSPVSPLFEGEILCGPLYASTGFVIAAALALERGEKENDDDDRNNINITTAFEFGDATIANPSNNRWIARWVSSTATHIRIWSDYQAYAKTNNGTGAVPLIVIDLSTVSIILGNGNSGSNTTTIGSSTSTSSTNLLSSPTRVALGSDPTQYVFRLVQRPISPDVALEPGSPAEETVCRFACESWSTLNNWYGALSRWTHHQVLRAGAPNRRNSNSNCDIAGVLLKSPPYKSPSFEVSPESADGKRTGFRGRSGLLASSTNSSSKKGNVNSNDDENNNNLVFSSSGETALPPVISSRSEWKAEMEAAVTSARPNAAYVVDESSSPVRGVPLTAKSPVKSRSPSPVKKEGTTTVTASTASSTAAAAVVIGGSPPSTFPSWPMAWSSNNSNAASGSSNSNNSNSNSGTTGGSTSGGFARRLSINAAVGRVSDIDNGLEKNTSNANSTSIRDQQQQLEQQHQQYPTMIIQQQHPLSAQPFSAFHHQPNQNSSSSHPHLPHTTLVVPLPSHVTADTDSSRARVEAMRQEREARSVSRKKREKETAEMKNWLDAHRGSANANGGSTHLTQVEPPPPDYYLPKPRSRVRRWGGFHTGMGTEYRPPAVTASSSASSSRSVSRGSGVTVSRSGSISRQQAFSAAAAAAALFQAGGNETNAASSSNSGSSSSNGGGIVPTTTTISTSATTSADPGGMRDFVRSHYEVQQRSRMESEGAAAAGGENSASDDAQQQQQQQQQRRGSVATASTNNTSARLLTLVDRTTNIGLRALAERAKSPVDKYVTNRSDAFHRAMGVPVPSSSLQSFSYHTGYERPGWKSSALGSGSDIEAANALVDVSSAKIVESGATPAVRGAGAPAAYALVAQPKGTAEAASLPVSAAVPRLALMKNNLSMQQQQNALNTSGSALMMNTSGFSNVSGSGAASVSGVGGRGGGDELRALSPGIKRKVMWAGQTWPKAEAIVVGGVGTQAQYASNNDNNAFSSDNKEQEREQDENVSRSQQSPGGFLVTPPHSPSSSSSSASAMAKQQNAQLQQLQNQSQRSNASLAIAFGSPVSILAEHIADVEGRLQAKERENDTLRKLLAAGRTTLSDALQAAASGLSASTTIVSNVAEEVEEQAASVASSSSVAEVAAVSTASGVVERVLSNPSDVAARLGNLAAVARSIRDGLTPQGNTSFQGVMHFSSSSSSSSSSAGFGGYMLSTTVNNNNNALGHYHQQPSSSSSSSNISLADLAAGRTLPRAYHHNNFDPTTPPRSSGRNTTSANINNNNNNNDNTISASPSSTSLTFNALEPAWWTTAHNNTINAGTTTNSHHAQYHQQYYNQQLPSSSSTFSSLADTLASLEATVNGLSSKLAMDKAVVAVTAVPAALSSTSFSSPYNPFSSPVSSSASSSVRQSITTAAAAPEEVLLRSSRLMAELSNAANVTSAALSPMHTSFSSLAHKTVSASSASPSSSTAGSSGSAALKHNQSHHTHRSNPMHAYLLLTNSTSDTDVDGAAIKASLHTVSSTALVLHKEAAPHHLLPILCDVALSTEETTFPFGRSSNSSSSSSSSSSGAELSSRLHQQPLHHLLRTTFDHVFESSKDTSFTLKDMITAIRVPRIVLGGYEQAAAQIDGASSYLPHCISFVLTASRPSLVSSAIHLAFGQPSSAGASSSSSNSISASSSSSTSSPASSSASILQDIITQTMISTLDGPGVTFIIRAVAAPVASVGTAAAAASHHHQLVDLFLPPSRRASTPAPTVAASSSSTTGNITPSPNNRSGSMVTGAVGVRVTQVPECTRLLSILTSRAESYLNRSSSSSRGSSTPSSSFSSSSSSLVSSPSTTAAAVIALIDCERRGQIVGGFAIGLTTQIIQPHSAASLVLFGAEGQNKPTFEGDAADHKVNILLM